MKACTRAFCLENKLQGELDEARIVECGVDLAEVGRSNVLHATTATWQVEMRMIPDVEELGPEIKTHALVRQADVFDKGHIGIDEARPAHGCAGSVPQFSVCRLSKARCVEPLVQRPMA